MIVVRSYCIRMNMRRWIEVTAHMIVCVIAMLFVMGVVGATFGACVGACLLTARTGWEAGK